MITSKVFHTRLTTRLAAPDVCWITSIAPERCRSGYTGDIEVRVNPAKKDGTRSNREFVLYYGEIDSIKKIN